MVSGDILREARLRAGLSQKELAARAGRPVSSISRYERGRMVPSLEVLRTLVAACGLQLTYGLRVADDSLDAFIRDNLALSPAARLRAGVNRAWAYERMQDTARRHAESPL